MQAKRGVRTKTYEKNEAPETPCAPNPLFYRGKRGCKREKKRGEKKTSFFYRKKQRPVMPRIAFGPPACIFTCFLCGTHVLTRKIRGLRDPRTARGAQPCAKGLTLAPASAPAHAAFLSKKTTSRGPRRASGASDLHFDTVFTCFSRRTHVSTRKKRRTVMPRIAWGP